MAHHQRALHVAAARLPSCFLQLDVEAWHGPEHVAENPNFVAGTTVGRLEQLLPRRSRIDLQPDQVFAMGDHVGFEQALEDNAIPLCVQPRHICRKAAIVELAKHPDGDDGDRNNLIAIAQDDNPCLDGPFCHREARKQGASAFPSLAGEGIRVRFLTPDASPYLCFASQSCA